MEIIIYVKSLPLMLVDEYNLVKFLSKNEQEKSITL